MGEGYGHALAVLAAAQRNATELRDDTENPPEVRERAAEIVAECQREMNELREGSGSE